ncbi:MAG: glycosyltransferase family 2 protein [Euryarchaeota archaeon]|nr:glycosyltransferase family 2 protein [Euryarchaeota archaeon]MBU4221447.1 glycosyltransferase family 2 protein [Euryarchaeota archaeon]MCG2736187.1 glycosyltransferase family 2 protein [Candidatus Methanoperedenaceae archaeon]
MNDPKVSIILVNYDGKKYLDACLSSLKNQTYYNFEVIFVDNASMDGSVDYVKAHFPSVLIIENPKNYGFAKGNNIGIGEAKGDLIATLNNDTEVTPGWIEELVKSINSDDNVGMCASKMMFMENRKTINSTGICISRSGACWDRGMFECDNGQYESIGEVFGPCAGAAMYRKSMLEEIGLFDEDFYAYMEDADLAFRGRLAGWKCLYVPKAVVYHVHGGTAGYATDYTIFYGNRNIIWNCIKNFPNRLLITSLLWIIGRNIAVIPYYVLKGHGSAIFKSKISAIRGIPKMLAKKSNCSVEEKEILRFIQTWADM